MNDPEMVQLIWKHGVDANISTKDKAPSKQTLRLGY